MSLSMLYITQKPHVRCNAKLEMRQIINLHGLVNITVIIIGGLRCIYLGKVSGEFGELPLPKGHVNGYITLGAYHHC